MEGFKYSEMSWAWILVLFMPILCLSAGFGEDCEGSSSCLAGFVCSTNTSKCQCEPGFNYIQEKCIETPYGGPCSKDEDCPLGSKCFDKNGNQREPLLCIAVPRGFQDVHVEQYLDDSMDVNFNISWKLREYTGPTWFVVDVRGKDFTMATHQYGSVTITKISETFLVTKTYVYSGWIYRILLTPVTAAGEGPEYNSGDFFSIESKPGLVQEVKVNQDSYFANQMKLTFECPISIERNGNITAFVIRKTITTDDLNVSTEYTIPHHFDGDKCKIDVNASQVGGIVVLNNYTFEVKIKNSKYEGDFTTPVSLFTHEREPYASTTAPLEDLLSPYEMKADNKVPSTFSIKLCSSCFLNPVQGPIKSAVIILCVETELQNCHSSFFQPHDGSMDLTASRPKDMNFYSTWASAKANNFSLPYRTTPEAWIETLRRNNSESMIYTIGSNKNCDEKNNATFCNGPLPYDKQFQVAVVVCNDGGCDVTLSWDEKFNTKAEVNDSSDNFILGLAIGLGLVSLICISIVIFICFRKSKTRSLQVTV